MKIVCISDTHGEHDKISIPMGDILVHAGDMSMQGTVSEISNFADWFHNQPHKYKVVIPGNHDWLFEKAPGLAEALINLTGITYLNDSGCEIMGLKFWGSPVQPWFHSWAFNRQRGAEIKKHWDMIPSDTDVLITHGPPWGILDQSYPSGEHLGCEELVKAVYSIDCKLHVFGHIHGGAGATGLGIKFVNAAVLNEQYTPNNKQFVVDL